MAKSKRDLLHALADRIGGAEGERMRAALSQPTPFDDLLDRPMSEAEFAAQWRNLDALERDLKSAFEKLRGADWEKPGSWGLPN